MPAGKWFRDPTMGKLEKSLRAAQILRRETQLCSCSRIFEVPNGSNAAEMITAKLHPSIGSRLRDYEISKELAAPFMFAPDKS